MTMGKQALKAGIAYTIISFMTAGISFITTPIFARILTKEDFGTYNTFISWFNIFSVVATLKINASFINARVDYRDDFNGYIFSSMGFVGVTLGIILIVFNIFSDFFISLFSIRLSYINLMIIYIFFGECIKMYQTREQYFFRYKQSACISLLLVSITVIASLFGVNLCKDRLQGRILGQIFPSIIIGSIVLGKFAIENKRIQIKYWKYAVPLTLPYIPHSLSLTLLNSLDKIMITKICNNRETALYSLAYTCSSIVTILMSSMNTAYSPWLAQKLEAKEHDEILKFSYLYISSFVFLVIGILLVAPEALLILGGKSYIEAKYVMPPVMIGCALQLLYTMYVNIEQFQKKTVGMAIASVCAAIINYILNLWLIPKFGYIAAAYTTWFGYLFLLSAHMILVQRLKLGRIYNNRFILTMVLIESIIMILMNSVYKHNIIRVVLFIIYILIFIFLLIKYSAKIRKLLRNK